MASFFSDELFNGLNTEQKQAVDCINGSLLVLAGAGTGKTKVITTRIAWMIKSNIPPNEIVALSFTNKAAREMRERLGAMVGETIAKNVILSTFHSFAMRILREFYKDFSLQYNFNIASETQSRQLLRDSLRELNLLETMPLAMAAEKISSFKDKLYENADFAKRTNLLDGVVMMRLFNIYNARLRLYNCVDFDDLVYLCVLGFRKNPNLLNLLSNRYKFLMVDEYQDTNNAQFEFIRLLAGKNNNICVVGDDDQSIYSWRGAKGEVLLNFLKCFPQAKQVTLEENYRCSPYILEAANAVISENTQRLSKKLWSRKPNLYPIHIHAAEETRDESLFVSDTIVSITRENPEIPFASFAVLTRTAEQMLPIEQVLAERKIPYVIHGGTRFLDKIEVRTLFSYLRFSKNTCDLTSLFAIINVPTRGIGTVTLEKIKTEFEKQKNSGADIVGVLQAQFMDNKGIADFLQNWLPVHKQIQEAKDLRMLREALLNCYENVGLKDDVLRTSKDMHEAKYKMDIIEKTLETVENIEVEEFSLDAVLDAMHLDNFSSARAKKDHLNAVQIMTIHAAKGLEFDSVFLVGVEDGILPHARSVEELGVPDEERRLFYVAITRAKQRLFISHCGFRPRGNRGSFEKERKVSPFLKAIPKHLIQNSEAEVDSQEVQRSNAARRLFDLFR